MASTAAGSAEAVPTDGPAPAKRERILARYAPASSTRLAGLEQTLGLRLSHRIDQLRVRVLDVPPDRMDTVLHRLRNTVGVEFAEPEGVLVASDQVPNDPLWALQWSAPRINAPRAWDLTTGSSRIVVAVLDSGVDGGHPELRGKLVAGYDHVNRDPDAADDNGHGTAVAGVVAAHTNNSEGVASFCWGCAIMPVKVLSADGSGTDSVVAAGMVWAVDQGANVLNLSLGGPTGSRTLDLAVRYARERGALPIAAAGNSASTAPTYPAAFPGVLGVAASDENDRLYPFSNSGPWVPLAAPGSNLAPWLGGTYTGFLGTSSASPVVAGVAGLALSLGASASQAEQALKETAVPISGVSSGRVDAFASISRFAPAPAPAPTEASGSETGQPAPAVPDAPPPAVTPPPAAVPPPPVAPSVVQPVRLRRVFRGHLSGRQRLKRYRLAAGKGRVFARLTIRGRSRMQLRIVSYGGKVLARARVRRRGALRIAVPGGAYRLVVAGRPRARTSFTLLVTYAKPG